MWLGSQGEQGHRGLLLFWGYTPLECRVHDDPYLMFAPKVVRPAAVVSTPKVTKCVWEFEPSPNSKFGLLKVTFCLMEHVNFTGF